MEWAELVLEYLKALVWPLVVVGAVYAFRSQIAAKIGDLKEAKTPVGGASFFDRDARELEEKAADAAERQEDATAKPSEIETVPSSGAASTPPTDGHDEVLRRREAIQRRIDKVAFFRALSTAADQLAAPPDFTAARSIAAAAPPAAVMLAYTELEKVARAAWTVSRMEAPRPSVNVPAIVRELAHVGGLETEFATLSRDLADLRNRLAHGLPGAEVSSVGALNFIAACESLSTALTQNAVSKLHHPTRSRIVQEWARWAEFRDLETDDNAPA